MSGFRDHSWLDMGNHMGLLGLNKVSCLQSMQCTCCTISPSFLICLRPLGRKKLLWFFGDECSSLFDSYSDCSVDRFKD